ncbi:DUF222 domain-containing protein [Actinomadura scrupuli]|uniref:DUF222 domain-containing protein n=1 Tax=Actinomadura scrupuli TaxID=559629 RepID=UPI003D9571FF
MRSVVAELAGASSAELVGAVEAIVGELAVRAAPRSGAAAMELAESLGRCLDVAEAALAVLVARVDETGVCREGGFSSPAAWLRGALGMRHGRAAERVTVARQLPRLPRVGKLLAGGGLSWGYAAAICQAVPRLDQEQTPVAEEILLGMAEEGLTVQQVIKAGDRITDLIAEHQGTEAEPAEARRGFCRSWFARSRSLDEGTWFKGWLNAEHTAMFDQIIGPLAKPRAQGDDRDLAQRTADALFSVISEGNKGAGLTLIVDLAAYLQATGDTVPRPHPPADSTPPAGAAGSGAPDAAADTTDTGPGHATAPTKPDADAEHAASEHAASEHPESEHADSEHFTAQQTGSERTTADTGAERSTAQEAGCEPTAQDTGHDHAVPQDTSPEADPEAGAFREAESGPDPGGGQYDTAPKVPPSPTPTPKRSSPATGDRARRVPARLLNGTPISPQDARRIALNAGISTLILGPTGAPLYLGRTVRFATPAQRKVLLALYETCIVHGCQIPAHLCEIHHLSGGWKLGTPTDIDQLAPACGWHNRWIDHHPDHITHTTDTHGRTILKIQPLWKTPRNTHHTPRPPQQPTTGDHQQPTTGDRQATGS